MREPREDVLPMSDGVSSLARPAGAKIVPPDLPATNSLLTLAVSVVVVAALYLAREVLIPVTLAVLLSFLLAPVASRLRRLHIGRIPSVLVAVLLALGVMAGAGSVVALQIASLAQDVPEYQTAITSKVEALRGAAVLELTELQLRLDRQLDHPAARPALSHARTPPAGSAQNPMVVQVEKPPAAPLDIARQVLGPIVGPIGTALLVVIVAVFVLLQEEDLRDRLIRLFGSNDLHRTTLAMNDAARRLSKYFLTQLAINASFGLVLALGLYVIGVPSPALWGFIGMLLRFVPYVGTFLSAAVPLLLAAAVDPGWTRVFWTAGLYFVAEAITGQVIEPVAYGHSTGLSPVSVVIAAIFWTWIWGPIGLILSTPLTLCLVVLGRHVESLAFLDVLLGDRPALTPIESLYQRMLANDADEASTQAEVLLRERPLSAYYDEVALKSLQMAAHDVARGVLSRERQAVMRDTVVGLVEDLAQHEDVTPSPAMADDGAAGLSAAEQAVPRTLPLSRQAPDATLLPPAWSGDAPVLCLGGRGPLDDAAAAMLAQLLRKHGLGARRLGHEAAGRDRVATLDVDGVAAICVSYMEATGSPAHLRFLLRRLHQRLPGAPLILGLWRDTPSGEPDAELLAVAAAETVGYSLRDAVSLCLQAADKAAGSAAVKTAVA
jgi:predicted PurR-regulated permease PerM